MSRPLPMDPQIRISRREPSLTLVLKTRRLVLVPVSLELLDALPNAEAAKRLLRATLPADWPDEELAGLLEL